MMKTKYERMSKEEKKSLVKKYKSTPNGKVMMNRLLRVNAIGVVGIFYSIFLLVSEYQNLTFKKSLVMIPLFLISIFFLFMSYRLRKKVLNQFAIKKK